ncbi:MAG: hypothetical protein CHACPFDD_00285 [Phycisphaerae bacterium]|nr:hypothetical protein [Phycisphaerae bacterium]
MLLGVPATLIAAHSAVSGPQRAWGLAAYAILLAQVLMLVATIAWQMLR